MLKREILKTGKITEEELERIAAIPNTAVARMVSGTKVIYRQLWTCMVWIHGKSNGV